MRASSTLPGMREEPEPGTREGPELGRREPGLGKRGPESGRRVPMAWGTATASGVGLVLFRSTRRMQPSTSLPFLGQVLADIRYALRTRRKTKEELTNSSMALSGISNSSYSTNAQG